MIIITTIIFIFQEALKRKEKRFDVRNKRIGKIANHKVRGLVEYIDFKRTNKFQ